MSGAGEFDSDRDTGGGRFMREAVGLKRPGEEAGVLWFVLKGIVAEGGIWAWRGR